MGFVFNWIARLHPEGFVAGAILFAIVGITGPVAYILTRRAYRRRYFRQRDRRTFEIRQQWACILSGAVKAETWRFRRMDRSIVETIVLDRLDAAPPDEAARLTAFLRTSGLLDMRIWEARHNRGWRRQRALVSLGRMRAPEAIPALAEALEDSNADVRIAALRGLGRSGLPAAAEEILRRVAHSSVRVPLAPLQNALLSCCRSSPAVLLNYVRRADDPVRPVLARVLGEVATPELDEELLLLASDPLPEVRASAARALGLAKPALALTALANLATDDSWFVRLRAVVALGELRDARTIPVLIGTLCDPNRYVRLRSAAALARLEEHLEETVQQVIQTGDRYALQAFVSELERSGRMMLLVQDLLDPARQAAARTALLGVVRAGTHRMLLDTLSNHSSRKVRFAVARLLAASGEERLVAPLQGLAASAPSPRARRIFRWILGRLREHAPSAPQPNGVPA